MRQEELDVIRADFAAEEGKPFTHEDGTRWWGIQETVAKLLAEIDRLRPVVKAAVGWSEDREVEDPSERALFDALVAAGELESTP